MKVRLEQGPEGAPNSSFGTYDAVTGDPIEFIQYDWNWPDMALMLGAQLPDPDEVGRTNYLSAAFDWLAAHDGEEFEVEEL